MVKDKKEIKKCSHTSNCGKQYWMCTNLTQLWREYTCENCKGTKTVFRNLYPGY